MISSYETQEERVKNYKEMVNKYYSVNTDLYIALWSEFFHVPIWKDPKDSINEAYRKTHEQYIADANLAATDKVIDLGCGIGTLSLLIAKTIGCHVTGINISKYQLKKANQRKNREQASNVDFREMDIMTLNSMQNHFNGAFLIDVGVHLPNKKKALANIYRVLQDNSRLIIADWLQKENLNNFERTVLIEPFCQYWAYPYMISLNQYEKILSSIGFHIVTIEDISDDVKKTWEEFYKVTLKTLNDISLLKMLKFIRNPEILFKYRKTALQEIRSAALAQIFTKVCSDAGVLRYGYIVAEK